MILRYPRWTNCRKHIKTDRFNNFKNSDSKGFIPIHGFGHSTAKIGQTGSNRSKKAPTTRSSSFLRIIWSHGNEIKSKKETQLRKEKIFGKRNPIYWGKSKGYATLKYGFIWIEWIVNNKYLKSNNNNNIIICREQRRKQWFWLAVPEFEKSKETEWKVGGYFFVKVTTEDKSNKSLFGTRLKYAWEWGVKLSSEKSKLAALQGTCRVCFGIAMRRITTSCRLFCLCNYVHICVFLFTI